MTTDNVDDSKKLRKSPASQEGKVRTLRPVPGNDLKNGTSKTGVIDNPVTDDIAKLNDAKARLANMIKQWMEDGNFKTIKQAAISIGEKRETLSRVLSLKLEKVSLDKLYRVAALAGLDVRVDAAAKIQIADEMSIWMSKLLEQSVAKLHDPKNRCELDSREALMEELVKRLRGYRNKTLPRGAKRKKSVRMICNDKRWDLDSCSAFYEEIANIGRHRNWDIRRVLVGGDGTIVHNRMLALISAETGVYTTLLDVSKGKEARFLPPRNVGFWIIDSDKIIMHTTSSAENVYVVEEVDDAALAAYLEQGVFARAERQGDHITSSPKRQSGG